MTSIPPSIVDAGQRQQALDPQRSFGVVAPAGSGKTELLTQRLLTLLAHCDQPENILAITFTRKAAAEMRLRLLNALRRADTLTSEERSQLPAHAAHTLSLAEQALARDRELGWSLLHNPSRLQITTIDSFNGTLAASLPLLSGFGAQPSITQDPQPLYEEAVASLLRQLESDSAIADDLAQVLAHLDNNIKRVHELLALLLGQREQWMDTVIQVHYSDEEAVRQRLEHTLSTVVRDSLARCLSSLQSWITELEDDLRFAREQLLRSKPEHELCASDKALAPEQHLRAVPEDLGLWQALASLLLTTKNELRKSLNKNDGFPADGDSKEEKERLKARKTACLARLKEMASVPEVSERLKEVRLLPSPALEEYQWQVLRALANVLRHLLAELSLVFQSHNECDYSQVSSGALQALGDDEHPTALTLRLDYQIRHILVDEFQDTSSQQVRLLESLTRGWQPGDGRTLFIVGDGMQSCYGFRNADVSLFLSALQRGIAQVPLTPLQLEVNFRSQGAVVEWVNQVFSRAFPAQDDMRHGAVSYRPSVALNADSGLSGVEARLLLLDKTEEEDARSVRRYLAREEAALVAEHIAMLQHTDPGASIALLVKNRSHARSILPALRERGIAWNAMEFDPLGSYSEVRDLLSLSRALLNRTDNSAWLALLRCPFIGLGMADLLTLSRLAQTHALPLSHALFLPGLPGLFSQGGQQTMARVTPVLLDALTDTAVVRERVETCWRALGGPACAGQSVDASHLDAFFSLLEEHSDALGVRSLDTLAEKLEQRYVNSKSSAGVTLQIMTIHKSKGLEFDYVILPGLSNIPRSDQPPLLQQHSYVSPSTGQSGLMLSIPGRRREKGDALHSFLSEESKQRRRLEETRVLYIGVTRAVKHALLVGTLRRDLKGETIDPPESSLLGRIWPALKDLPSKQCISLPAASGDSGKSTLVDAVPSIQTAHLPYDWQSPLLIDATALDDSIALSDEDDDRHPGAVNLLDRIRGDIVHECLQSAAEAELELSDDQALNERRPFWERRLAQACSDAEAQSRRLLEDMRQLAQSAQARWLLDPSHEDSACELALSDFRGQWHRASIVDRSFIDQEGTRWVIDYKSRVLPDSGREAMVEEEKQRYQEQMARYRSLFQAMEPERPVRCALYFPLSDTLAEYP